MLSFAGATSSVRFNPAYGAALALIAIQVSMGVLFKAAQTEGRYPFSTSSSNTISEFLKFLLATLFFYRECSHKYISTGSQTFSRDVEYDKEKEPSENDSEDQAFLKSTEKMINRVADWKPSFATMKLGTFYQYFINELPAETRYGFAFLALFYVLINNTVFLLYKLADPGTIQLIKSGTTLITAVVSMMLLGTKVSRGQWIAISLQVCGIVVTQYKEGGAAYPLGTYLVLLFQTTVSAVASVYNQKLCKGVNASVHVMNMCLYFAGTAINLLLHIMTRMIKPDEPGFFTGYNSVGSILVIMSHVFIGLAMTAVFKYADAIIKCFATAISTAALLYISPILFGVDISFLVLPGTSVVFLATWLYIEATPSRSSAPAREVSSTDAPQRSFGRNTSSFFSPRRQLRHLGLGAATLFVIFIISSLTSWETRNAETNSQSSVQEPVLNVTKMPVVESPFQNTLAFVRWNRQLEQRLPVIQKGYEPFFHTMHYSMPNITGVSANSSNITHDAWEDKKTVYRAVSKTMQTILKETREDEITGMLFFHFDLWVDPLGFADMDYKKIWYPDSENPKFRCMNNTARYREWWGWYPPTSYHQGSLQATRFAANSASKLQHQYTIDPEEWCVGWSDIYYVPRHLFGQYIELSAIFATVPVFHEIAIPTMFHIIDRTRERRPSHSLITRVGDCWGNCCASDPTVEDILWARCGHRLDLQNKEVSGVHFNRLKQQSLILGSPIEEGNYTQPGSIS